MVVGGIEQSLEVASGARTGIKINLDSDLAAGMTYALVLDYNAAKSIKSTGQGYLMTPVIEMKSLTGTPARCDHAHPGPLDLGDRARGAEAPAAPADRVRAR